MNLTLSVTQDFRSELLSVALARAGVFAGDGARATRGKVKIRGQECPRYAGQLGPTLSYDSRVIPGKPSKPASKPITLSGCVQRGESAQDQFTLSEKKGSQVYRLTGPDLREYVGRRVQIVGGVASKRFRIVGGLTPSARARW